MGRKFRCDVDYFPFFSKEGRTLFILESKYQCKGTGFFTNCLRFLSRVPNHHFQLQTESDRLYFFASVKCDPESAIDMIEIMVNTGKLDSELWISKKVIASQDFLDSVQEAYRKRENKCITIDEIKAIYDITSGRNTPIYEKLPEEILYSNQLDSISSGDNPQTKVKKTKVKKTKVKKSKVNIPEEYLQLSSDFHNWQHKAHPNLLRDVNDKLIKDGAIEIEKLIKIDKYTVEEIKQALKFSVNDKFWSSTLISLRTIRNNKSGQTKFVNILASMEKSRDTATLARRNAQAMEKCLNE